MSTAQDNRETSGNRRVVIGTMAGGHAINISIMLLLGLLLPEMAEELDLSPSQQGWLGSASTITSLFIAIPTNTWTSRYRPWRVTSLAFLGVAGFVFLQGWAPIFAVLLVGRVGMGLAFTAGQAAAPLLVQQWSSRRQVSSTNGMIVAGSDIVLAFVFFITPFILGWLDGWRNTLYLWGGVSLIGALAWVILGKERITPGYSERLASQVSTPLFSILRYKALWVLAMGMGGAMVLESAFSVFWPTYVQDRFQVEASVVGFALGIFFLSAAPAELLVTALPPLMRRRSAVLAATGLITFGAHMGLLFTGSTPVLLLLAVVRGIAISYFPVIMIAVYLLPGIRPREVTVGIGFIYTALYTGSTIGPLLVGFLEEATGDLRLALMVTVFFPLALVLTAVLLRVEATGLDHEAPAPV